MDIETKLSTSLTRYLNSLSGRNLSEHTETAYRCDLLQVLTFLAENDVTVNSPEKITRNTYSWLPLAPCQFRKVRSNTGPEISSDPGILQIPGGWEEYPLLACREYYPAKAGAETAGVFASWWVYAVTQCLRGQQPGLRDFATVPPNRYPCLRACRTDSWRHWPERRHHAYQRQRQQAPDKLMQFLAGKHLQATPLDIVFKRHQVGLYNNLKIFPC